MNNTRGSLSRTSPWVLFQLLCQTLLACTGKLDSLLYCSFPALGLPSKYNRYSSLFDHSIYLVHYSWNVFLKWLFLFLTCVLTRSVLVQLTSQNVLIGLCVLIEADSKQRINTCLSLSFFFRVLIDSERDLPQVSWKELAHLHQVSHGKKIDIIILFENRVFVLVLMASISKLLL